ncbi:MAG: hypothetical protein AAFP83_10835, partial [Bacteroidota bacterium]
MKYIGKLSLLLALVLSGLSLQGQAPTGEVLSDETTSIPGFVPMEVFQNPSHLMRYWGNEPIPLESYTEQEEQIQALLNDKEDFLVTQSPLSEDGLQALDGDYHLIDQDLITPYTWKWAELRLDRADGITVKIKLRRPNWWLIQQGLTEPGAEIFMSLGEMKAEGMAQLIRLWPNQLDMRFEEAKPDLQPITGVYKYESPETWDYVIDQVPLVGRDTLSSTSAHPFWSIESDGWKQIGDIPPGEHIGLKDQQQAQLIAKHRREARGEYVYNFEVYKDHHYFVGEGLAWAHNCKVGKLVDELPVLDGTGKIHTGDGFRLPDASELNRFELDDLRRFRDDLEVSVQNRIKSTNKAYDDGSYTPMQHKQHGERQAQEQQLINSY